ncbi:MAG: hypothetical protein HFE62_03985 [Firmicutes bacterium]|nr:hypothetical protein [Bacillota bacterium]
MDIKMVGSMRQHIKISGMKQKWELKKSGALSTFDKLSLGISSTNCGNSGKAGIYEKVRKLKEKLKTGGRLTMEEKEFLRQNTPEIYKKIEEAERERDSHAARLRACKTKEEMERVKASKKSEIMASMADRSGDFDMVEIRTAQTNAAASEVSSMSKPHKRDIEKNERQLKEEKTNDIKGRSEKAVENRQENERAENLNTIREENGRIKNVNSVSMKKAENMEEKKEVSKNISANAYAVYRETAKETASYEKDKTKYRAKA